MYSHRILILSTPEIFAGGLFGYFLKAVFDQATRVLDGSPYTGL
jgi:hypothetical protein